MIEIQTHDMFERVCDRQLQAGLVTGRQLAGLGVLVR